MPEPTFTLQCDEQTWLVSLLQGVQDRSYRLRCTKYLDGSVTIKTASGHEEFRFLRSDSNTVLAIGRLLIAAARKAGAMDA